jgi:hypothetical protein
LIKASDSEPASPIYVAVNDVLVKNDQNLMGMIWRIQIGDQVIGVFDAHRGGTVVKS